MCNKHPKALMHACIYMCIYAGVCVCVYAESISIEVLLKRKQQTNKLISLGTCEKKVTLHVARRKAPFRLYVDISVCMFSLKNLLSLCMYAYAGMYIFYSTHSHVRINSLQYFIGYLQKKKKMYLVKIISKIWKISNPCIA